MKRESENIADKQLLIKNMQNIDAVINAVSVVWNCAGMYVRRPLKQNKVIEGS